MLTTKKLLAAAAVCATAVGAHAQSSVTIYGVIDLAVSKGNGGTANSPGANGTNKETLVRQSASSRLGFRGTEDLGGGMTAGFNLDHRFTPDDGVAATPFWRGKSIVTLGHRDYGQIALGRDYVPAFYVGVKSDPFGYDGVGAIAVQQFGGYRSTGGVQAGNAVFYRSPSLGGLVVSGMVSLGEGATARATGGAFEYTQGPIYAALGFERLDEGGAALDGNQFVSAAFHYNFGWIKPMLYVARSEAGATGNSDDMVMLGALIPAGANGRVKAAWSRLDPSGANNTQSKIGLGYEHFLSKRTNLYADLGMAKEDQKTNNRAWALGVKHTW